MGSKKRCLLLSADHNIRLAKRLDDDVFFFNSHYARWAYGLCRASRAYALDDVSFASFALNKYVNQFHLIHTIHIFFQNDSTFSESHGLTPTYLLRQNACLLVSPGNPGIQNVV